MFNRKIWTISWKIHRPYEWMWVGGTSTYTKEVTGNWYIDLTDAVANSLQYVKVFGACEQDSTPTPSTPVDIKCNNGVLKVKDKELPVWYKRLTWIKTDGSVRYKITDFYLTGEDDIEFRFNRWTSTWWNCLWSYTSSSATDNFSMYYTSNSGWKYTRYDGSSYTSYIPQGNTTYKINMWVSGVKIWTSWTLVPVTPSTFTCSEEFYIFTIWSSMNNTPSGCYFNGNITVTRWDNVRLNLIPCERVSDWELWWYDTVWENFYENLWNWTPTSTWYDYNNLEVYVDGTTETIEDELWNTATAQDLLWVWDYVDSQEILTGVVKINVWVMVLNGNENWSTAWSGSSWRATTSDDIWLPETTSLTAPMMCTHYEFGGYFSTWWDTTQWTFNWWKSWDSKFLRFSLVGMSMSSAADRTNRIKAQYDAWTPVIVVYPLATEETKSVAGQTLTIQEWDNRIEITQAEISWLPLYAKYKSTTE